MIAMFGDKQKAQSENHSNARMLRVPQREDATGKNGEPLKLAKIVHVIVFVFIAEQILE
ncbi:hypothetical protein NBRC116587_21410 [Pseudoteredinibacter isoporae]